MVFNCFDCKSIPIVPVQECSKCETIFCKGCINKFQTLNGDVKCSKCNDFVKLRVINRAILRMVEKVEFSHSCVAPEDKTLKKVKNSPTKKQKNECEEIYKYDHMIKHLKSECPLIKNHMCP
mgnify:CR=1 FL=1